MTLKFTQTSVMKSRMGQIFTVKINSKSLRSVQEKKGT